VSPDDQRLVMLREAAQVSGGRLIVVDDFFGLMRWN